MKAFLQFRNGRYNAFFLRLFYSGSVALFIDCEKVGTRKMRQKANEIGVGGKTYLGRTKRGSTAEVGRRTKYQYRIYKMFENQPNLNVNQVNSKVLSNIFHLSFKIITKSKCRM